LPWMSVNKAISTMRPLGRIYGNRGRKATAPMEIGAATVSRRKESRRYCVEDFGAVGDGAPIGRVGAWLLTGRGGA